MEHCLYAWKDRAYTSNPRLESGWKIAKHKMPQEGSLKIILGHGAANVTLIGRTNWCFVFVQEIFMETSKIADRCGGWLHTKQLRKQSRLQNSIYTPMLGQKFGRRRSEDRRVELQEKRVKTRLVLL